MLITSPQSISLDGTELEVGGFTSKQSCDFLVRLAQKGKFEDLPEKERLAAQKLVDKLSNMPLAIDIAGTFLRKAKSTLVDYLHGWEEILFNNVGKGADSTGYGKELVSALQMNFREAFRQSREDQAIEEVVTPLSYSDSIPIFVHKMYPSGYCGVPGNSIMTTMSKYRAEIYKAAG